MKKLFLILCFVLTACDNNTFIGKCLKTTTTTKTTEQNGKVIATETNNMFTCGCFETQESSTPDFMIPKESFLFETSHTETFEQLIENVEYTITTDTNSIDKPESQNNTNKACNTDCTKLCNSLISQ